MEKQNEVEKFFQGLPSQEKKAAVFDEEKKDVAGDTADAKRDGETDAEAEVRKNRRHRRLEEQLQNERESNIALNERLKAATQAERTARESGGKLDPRLLRLFGSDEKGTEATALMTEIMRENAQQAKAEALDEIESRQKVARDEQKKFESFIDSELENLEEQHNVDLTSNAPTARKARREFLEMVSNLSPKDEDGTITGYANFETAFELYQKTRKDDKSAETSQKQKEVASRSMQRAGGGSSETAQKVTPGFFGWRRDFNIQ